MDKLMGWQPIETAQKDFTGVLLFAIGADSRPMIVKAHWGCKKHCFSSAHQCSKYPQDDCQFEWLGELATRYGVTFTHWMPLPKPPEAE